MKFRTKKTIKLPKVRKTWIGEKWEEREWVEKKGKGERSRKKEKLTIVNLHLLFQCKTLGQKKKRNSEKFEVENYIFKNVTLWHWQFWRKKKKNLLDGITNHNLLFHSSLIEKQFQWYKTFLPAFSRPLSGSTTFPTFNFFFFFFVNFSTKIKKKKITFPLLFVFSFCFALKKLLKKKERKRGEEKRIGDIGWWQKINRIKKKIQLSDWLLSNKKKKNNFPSRR